MFSYSKNLIKRLMLCLCLFTFLCCQGCASSHKKTSSKSSSRGGCKHVYKIKGKSYCVKKSAQGYKARGIASWYGPGFHGKKAADGSRYNMYSMTAAHKTLPLGTQVKVTNLKNRRSVVVKITDRGPFKPNRIIDLSKKAASKLGITQTGIAQVEVKALK